MDKTAIADNELPARDLRETLLAVRARLTAALHLSKERNRSRELHSRRKSAL